MLNIFFNLRGIEPFVSNDISRKKTGVKDVILPIKSDAIKSYTDEQINWVKENEIYIWQYFIENQLLYNTSPSLQQRFIEPAPFSKFYLEIDNESPEELKYEGKSSNYMGKS